MAAIYVKDCKCRATATTNEIRVSTKVDDKSGAHTVTATLIPGPSCDACGKAWKPGDGRPKI